MTVPTLTPPAATRPTPRYRPIAPAELVHDLPIGPTDPARVDPCHLPTLAHVASDLESLTAPVRVVPAADLGVCVECSSGPNDDLPVLDAIATVRATDAYGHVTRDEVCAVHLHLAVHGHARRERLVTVGVPAAPTADVPPAYHRGTRGTWYRVGRYDGVLTHRSWEAWDVVEATPCGLLRPLATVRDRATAETLAQAVAAQRAADAAELVETLAQVA